MKSFFLVIGLSYLVLTPAYGQVANAKYSELQLQIDSIITAEMEKRKVPGLVYGVFDNNSVLLTNSFGFADVQNNAPANINTVFELASITKQFTASAILLLQQDGKLNLNDYLYEYFPECPDGWREITILQLLTHTSGLPGLYGDDGFNKNAFTGINQMAAERVSSKIMDWDKSFTIDAIKTDSLVYAPGDKHVYSDIGYILLGIIVDNISGSYREFINERIFKPTGMTSSYILDQEKVHPNEARGYSLKDGELINIQRFWKMDIPSHYGIFSTVGDMQKWDSVLNNNSILSEQSKTLLWKNYQLNDSSRINYGLGWELLELGTNRIITHTGVTGTEIVKSLNDSITICVLTNLGYNGNDNVQAWGFCAKIGEVLGVNLFVSRETYELQGLSLRPFSKKYLKNIIGTYSSPIGNLEIYSQKDKLFINARGKSYELILLKDGRCAILGRQQELFIQPVDDGYDTINLGGFEAKKVDKP